MTISLEMDKWTKKKRAAESCGGKGMTKFVDSTEARRLSRLKNTKSSIGTKMTHSGWQKNQIEKRRKEQLRQRKEKANQKPIGEGIRVDTSIQPCDYTKTGLKLKLDQPTSKQTVKERNPIALPSRLRTHKGNNSSKLRGTRTLNSIQSQNVYSPRGDNHIDVELLEDGAIVCDSQQHPRSLQTNAVEGELKDHLRDLGLSSTATLSQNVKRNGNEGTSKRNSLIPRLSGQTCGPIKMFQTNAGKENYDKYFDPPLQYSRPTKLKKSEGQEKHFELLTDINSLKREHADAIKMLQEMDREENRRRSLDSESTSYSCDSVELNDNIVQNDQVNNDINDQDEFRNYKSFCNFEGDYFEIVSSSDAGKSSSFIDETEPKTHDMNLGESFAWLPDGIKDASHLSIVLRDELESEIETVSTGRSVDYSNHTDDCFCESFRGKAACDTDPQKGVQSDEESQECIAVAGSINASYDAESSSHADDY